MADPIILKSYREAGLMLDTEIKRLKGLKDKVAMQDIADAVGLLLEINREICFQLDKDRKNGDHGADVRQSRVGA